MGWLVEVRLVVEVPDDMSAAEVERQKRIVVSAARRARVAPGVRFPSWHDELRRALTEAQRR